MSTTKKYPAPIYAVAGVGDYAYQQLRKLPAKLTELPTRVSHLRERVAPADFTVRPDLDHLREAARRNALHVLGEARTVYADLVARGERVVDGPGATVPESGDEPVTEADVADTVEAAVVVEAPVVAEATKPAKRTRPATRK